MPQPRLRLFNMSKNLVIVESPAKARTIEKYLGGDYQVMASFGHVRDLVPKEGAVDTENDFHMKYEVIDRNRKHVDAIAKAMKKSDALYLATDPDREGEAISWHLLEVLRERGVLDDKPVHRIVFYEITKPALQKAIEQPRRISEERVNAQQARRALDYLVGFNLSPLLWKKVRRGLSAGRVQTPALRLICEREEAIDAFVPREYWSIAADASLSGAAFNARLLEYRGDKVEQFTFENERDATGAREALVAEAGGHLTVGRVERRQRRRNPAAPFTTSTLQQEASRKLGFSASRTMRVAQSLYEGIETDEGAVGLITYMRTDSVQLAGEAISEIRDLVARRYGDDNIPDKPRAFKTTAKNAQEAHEAIRPTSVKRVPESLTKRLNHDQRRLYDLIWKRTVASQMIHATFDTVSVDLIAGDLRGELRNNADGEPELPREGRSSFRATGSVMRHPGFIAVYQEGRDDQGADDGDRILPDMNVGDLADVADVQTEQHFTEPPPRFTEATLVKTLEEYGIGRPSTYASIISTLQQREYVEMDGRRFIPTDVGKIVHKFLTQHFPQYVDYEFTARMEDSLDEIFRGEREWVPLMRDFWKDFRELVEHKDATVTREQAAQARDLGTDPVSGRPMTVRMGRFGPFIQVGTKDDEEKPKFAGLRPGQKMDRITREEALELFKLPRDLGETDAGEELQANIGRFGPYVRYGSKFVSIPADEDPLSITRERALELVAEKKAADARRTIQEFDNGIRVLDGRYGPYVTDGSKNAKIAKDTDPKSLTLADCEKLLAEAPARRGRGGKAGAAKKATGKKTAAKKSTTKKSAAKKSTAKKAASKKTSKKKAAKKKTSKKKAAARKTTAKAGARKAAKKKATGQASADRAGTGTSTRAQGGG